MKKIIALLLLLSLVFGITACGNGKPKEISCDEIIVAYEEAGYSVLYHGHEGDTAYNDLGIYCSFEVREKGGNADNYVYIDRYFTAEQAEAAYKEQMYHPLLWVLFAAFGETRWLHTGCYGDIVYSSFEYGMLKPLLDLTR